MTRRAEFSKATRLLAFQRADGRCECGCMTKLTAGEVQYDHIVPDAIEGSNDLSNCMVMRTKCHRLKTSTVDVPEIAKSVRVFEKRAGLRKTKRGFRKAPPGYSTFDRKWKD